MIPKKSRYVEVCPQCRRGLDKTEYRLVTDGCGHTKCRVCILQEMSGCLKCAENNIERVPVTSHSVPPPVLPRKSVIMCTEEFQMEPKSGKKNVELPINNDILFPPEMLKRNTKNFFHLKRVISERYYSEGGGKEDKSCGTESHALDLSKKLPPHILHYCEIHKTPLRDEAALMAHRKCRKNSCDTCNKVFTDVSKLRKHRASHRIRKFTCSICSKSFRENYLLLNHKKVHSKAGTFKCDICNAQLRQLHSLRRHQALHKGERNFSCSVKDCKYKALTKVELNMHFKSHSKNKRFTCNQCGMRFSCRRTLVRHSASHDPKSAPLVCKQCGVSFKRKDNLLRHQKNTHGESDSNSVLVNDQEFTDPHSEMTTVFEFDQSKFKTQS